MVHKGWIRKLFEETKQWVAEGIIDEGQAARIKSVYSGKIEYGRLINTFAMIGSVLVGLGILLFVASNWDKLGRPTKIIIIFSAIAGFNFTAYYFYYFKKDLRSLTEGFSLIGAFAFGAGIWLIAQMYQIHYNFSAGMIFWILGIIPVALICRSWTIVALSSILSWLWLISYNVGYFQREACGFFLLALIIIALSYFYKQKFALFIIIAAFLSWLFHFWIADIMRVPHAFDNNALMPQMLLVMLYASFGIVLYGLGIWHQKIGRFAGFSFMYKFLGMLILMLSTYSLTFAHHYYKHFALTVPAATGIVIFLLSIIAVSLFYFLSHLLAEGAERKEARLVFGFFILQLIATVISFVWPIAASPVYNIALLVQVLGFMYAGFLRHSEGIFRMAIIVFFLDILSRYFDIFWQMMPRSILFIFGGIILIGGAIFADRKRKEMEQRMSGGLTR